MCYVRFVVEVERRDRVVVESLRGVIKADNDIVAAVASNSFIGAMSILNCSSPGRCATPTNEDVVIQGKYYLV